MSENYTYTRQQFPLANYYKPTGKEFRGHDFQDNQSEDSDSAESSANFEKVLKEIEAPKKTAYQSHLKQLYFCNYCESKLTCRKANFARHQEKCMLKCCKKKNSKSLKENIQELDLDDDSTTTSGIATVPIIRISPVMPQIEQTDTSYTNNLFDQCMNQLAEMVKVHETSLLNPDTPVQTREALFAQIWSQTPVHAKQILLRSYDHAAMNNIDMVAIIEGKQAVVDMHLRDLTQGQLPTHSREADTHALYSNMLTLTTTETTTMTTSLEIERMLKQLELAKCILELKLGRVTWGIKHNAMRIVQRSFEIEKTQQGMMQQLVASDAALPVTAHYQYVHTVSDNYASTNPPSPAKSSHSRTFSSSFDSIEGNNYDCDNATKHARVVLTEQNLNSRTRDSLSEQANPSSDDSVSTST